MGRRRGDGDRRQGRIYADFIALMPYQDCGYI